MDRASICVTRRHSKDGWLIIIGNNVFTANTSRTDIYTRLAGISIFTVRGLFIINPLFLLAGRRRHRAQLQTNSCLSLHTPLASQPGFCYEAGHLENTLRYQDPHRVFYSE